MPSQGKLTLWEKTKAGFKWVDSIANNRPRMVNLEVTKKCNARCDFCHYWMTKREDVLDDYAPVIRRFRPMVVNISGGEPTLRKDLPELTRKMKDAQSFLYIQMITNGSLMTPELGQKLFEAGMNAVNFSVDFPDERHDKGRGLKHSLQKIKDACEYLPEIGFDRVGFNTFINAENMDSAVDIARLAHELKVSISFSTYSPMKTDDDRFMVEPTLVPRLHNVIEQLVAMKRKTGHIRNSDEYLWRIPEYFAKGGLDGCEAGKKWIHVTPDGHIQPCSELEIIAHYSNYSTKDLEKADICDKCWFACRGESSVPISVRRVGEFISKPNFDTPLPV